MAKKQTGTEAATAPPEHLNALIPADLKRRIKFAALHCDTTVTALLIRWIEEGLAKVEQAQGRGGK